MPQPTILWKWLEDVLQWLYDVLLFIPLKVWEGLLSGLASLIEAIPVPGFMQNLGSYVAGIDPGIAFFLSSMNFGTGIAMILGAYAIRFVIRRIPVVG